jgi:hypothetical protein
LFWAAVTDTPNESARRKLRTPALILLGLIGIDIAVRLTADTWARHSPDDYAERVDGCAARPRDFVLVGGSPVSEGLYPTFVAGSGFGWRGELLTDGYAVGLPGATTSDVYHAVLRTCPVPPKLLVYGITASDINDARGEPHGPYSLMTWGDLREWMNVRPDAGSWAAKHFLQGRLTNAWAAYRYRHGVRMWATLRADAAFPGCCPEAIREAKELAAYSEALRSGEGYAPAAGFAKTRYDEVKRVGGTTPPFNFLDKYRTGSHLKYLHRMLDWAAERGTAVVLVDMPVTADLEARYPDAIAEYQARLAEVEAARGVKVLRASRDAVGLDDTHFADVIHLNAVGARMLSRWMQERLVEVGAGPEAGMLASRRQMSGGTGP